jgi:rhodanese-related sulfurtransferase
MRRTYLARLVFPAFLIAAALLTGSCAEKAEIPAQIVEDITVQQASELIQKKAGNPDFVIVDVRTPEEFAEEHLENAVNIDFRSATFRDELDKLDRERTYLIYCRSGARAANALAIMGELNFKEVYNMGGIIQWKEAGFTTVR